MNVYQIDFENPTAPPIFIVAKDIAQAAETAINGSTTWPSGAMSVAAVSKLGRVFKAAGDC